MRKNKIFAFILSFAMLFGSVASAATFSDMPSNPEAQNAIENAVKNGIISGYTDGTFKPDAYITRAEMASIITRACGAKNEGNISSFSDVTPDKWYYSSVAKAYEMGALSGSDGKMNPDNFITFQECFTVLSNVFDLIPEYTISGYVESSTLPSNIAMGVVNNRIRLYDISVLEQYTDNNEIADWAKIYVAGVVTNGGWNGVDNKLTPTKNITRLQFAMVMDNLFKTYIDEPGTYSSIPEGNVLVRCDGAVLKNITTNDDIYIADGVSPNGVTLDNIKTNGRLVIRGCATPTVDENGAVSWGDAGLLIKNGYFEKVRIIRPCINVNMLGAEYGVIFGAKNTHCTAFAKQ